VPEGPTSLELAKTLERMFAWPKAAAIGIAPFPLGNATRGPVTSRRLSPDRGAVEASKAGESGTSHGNFFWGRSLEDVTPRVG